MVAENKNEHTCGHKQNKNIYVCVYIYMFAHLLFAKYYITFVQRSKKKEKKYFRKVYRHDIVLPDRLKLRMIIPFGDVTKLLCQCFSP